MSDLQVTSITLNAYDKSCHGITFLGGPGDDGTPWKWSVDKVIANIDAHKNTFYTEIGGERKKIDVKTEPGKARYLKTRSDDGVDDTLLSLPAS